MCSRGVALVFFLAFAATFVIGESRILSESEFKEVISAGPVFVKFFAPW